MSKKSCNFFGSHFLWMREKKKYQYDDSNNDTGLIKSDNVMDKSIGLTSSLNAVEAAAGSAINISSHSVHANEQLNGITTTQPIDLQIDHDDYNTSALLATEKRNGIQEKTNFVDVNLNHAKSYSSDNLPNIQGNNGQHGSPSDSIELFDDDDSDDNSEDVVSIKLNPLNLPKAGYLKLPKLPLSRTVEGITNNKDTVDDTGNVEDTTEVQNSDDDKENEENKCEECFIDCLYCSLLWCECTIS